MERLYRNAEELRKKSQSLEEIRTVQVTTHSFSVCIYLPFYGKVIPTHTQVFSHFYKSLHWYSLALDSSFPMSRPSQQIPLLSHPVLIPPSTSHDGVPCEWVHGDRRWQEARRCCDTRGWWLAVKRLKTGGGFGGDKVRDFGWSWRGDSQAERTKQAYLRTLQTDFDSLSCLLE